MSKTLIDMVPDELVVRKQKAKASGKFGLYAEADVYVETNFWFVYELRMFISDTAICVYKRNRGRKAGRWAMTTFKDDEGLSDGVTFDMVRERALAELTEFEEVGYSVALRGDPILVELSIDDATALAAGGLPNDRYMFDTYGSNVWGDREADETWSSKVVDGTEFRVDYSVVDDEEDGEDEEDEEVDGPRF